MCLILAAWHAHPDYRLILAANRDEFHARPTRASGYWEDAPGILAGRDLVHGGTWLGVDRRGRAAAVTNIREPSQKRPESRSRGLLVSEYLRSADTAAAYLERVDAEKYRYDPFNLLVMNGGALYFLSRLKGGAVNLQPGIYGVSNGPLDCPWPKVTRGKDLLRRLIDDDRVGADALFDILGDTAAAPDADLPDTGVGIEMERVLSAAFIRTETYGTRASTVLMVDRRGRVSWSERSFDPAGRVTGSVSLDFRAVPPDVAAGVGEPGGDQ